MFAACPSPSCLTLIHAPGTWTCLNNSGSDLRILAAVSAQAVPWSSSVHRNSWNRIDNMPDRQWNKVHEYRWDKKSTKVWWWQVRTKDTRRSIGSLDWEFSMSLLGTRLQLLASWMLQTHQGLRDRGKRGLVSLTRCALNFRVAADFGETR